MYDTAVISCFRESRFYPQRDTCSRVSIGDLPSQRNVQNTMEGLYRSVSKKNVVQQRHHINQDSGGDRFDEREYDGRGV